MSADLVISPTRAEPGAVSAEDPRAQQVLALLGSAAGPLTLRDLHRRTEIPVSDLEAMTSDLRSAGRIRRLHTVIESYRSCVAVDSLL